MIAVLTLATLATVTVELAPSGLLPHMSTDLGVPLGAVGLLVTVWALTIALGSIPLVRATSRIPRRTLLSAALTVTAVANAATALAPNFAVAFLGRLVAAGAHGLFWALVVTFVASIVRPEKLGTSLSIVLAGPAFAGLVSLPAATAVADAVGWRPTLLVLSILLFTIAIAVWVVVGGPENNSDAQEQPGRWDRSARQVLTVAAGGSLVIAAHFAVFTYVAPIVVDLGGFAPTSIASVLLAFGVANAVGVAAAGVVSDRHPRGAAPAAAALLALGVLTLRLGTDTTAVFCRRSRPLGNRCRCLSADSPSACSPRVHSGVPPDRRWSRHHRVEPRHRGGSTDRGGAARLGGRNGRARGGRRRSVGCRGAAPDKTPP